MPCLVALLVLSILGVFSASHRRLAKEAFDCVFRRVTLRPCNTGFDVKIKAKVLGPILSRSPQAAKFVNRYFEGMAWFLIIGLTLSSLWTIRGIYNYWAWGNCEGQFSSGGFCVFDPTGANSQASGQNGNECTDQKLAGKALSVSGVDTTQFPLLRQSENPKTILFVGCYSCDYTRKAYPTLKKVFDQAEATIRFAHFATIEETAYIKPYDACVQQLLPEAYFKYIDTLFTGPKEQLLDPNYVNSVIHNLGITPEALSQCLSDPKTQLLVEAQEKSINEYWHLWYTYSIY